MAGLAVGLLLVSSSGVSTQTANAWTPVARLIPSTTISLPGQVDSNSPAVWGLDRGLEELVIFSSFAGMPSRAEGRTLQRLSDSEPVALEGTPPGIWLEAVVEDEAGTWYGYYHNEVPAEICGRPNLFAPRIGAMRSVNLGRTWQDLGIVLEASPRTLACQTTNRYFVGGVGDFSVVLDRAGQDLYFFYSQYPSRVSSQGVAIGRLAWADRDAPVGRLTIWNGRTWLPPHAMRSQGMEGPVRWSFPTGSPIFRASQSLHDGDGIVDTYWGPSVHWNTYLQRYVMLLNHAIDGSFKQEGIYISYTDAVESPTSWSPPVKLVSSDTWYPQVLGLEPSTGTDRMAGEFARFFVGGRSRFLIQFAMSD